VNSELERMLDAWVIAWSSSDSTDPERVLALFADDCVSRTLRLASSPGAKRNFAASRTALSQQSLTSDTG
jgi:hypothetical protein